MALEDDETFREIIAANMEDEATDLLGKHLERCRAWREEFRGKTGLEPTMHDLIKQIVSEPNRKMPVLVAFGAALWKMMEEE